MKFTPELKAEIDAMTLEEMIRKWRFAPISDPLLQNEAGEYLQKRMFEIRDADNDTWVATSKSVGWK